MKTFLANFGNFESLKFKALRGIAKKLNVKNYFTMNEDELKNKLTEVRSNIYALNYPYC